MRRQIAGLVIVSLVGGARLAAQDSAAAARAPITARVHGHLIASRSSGAPTTGVDANLWADTPELRTLFTTACTAARANEPSWMGARTELVAPSGMALDSAAAADLSTLQTLVTQPHAATHVDSTGAFAFDSVPAGDYWIEAESTQGASIVQWWRRVSYAPADLAVARLMAGQQANDPLDVALGEHDTVRSEFCIDSVASRSGALAEEASYRIIPPGAASGPDTPPIPLRAPALSELPSSIANRSVVTAVTVSFTVLADGSVDPNSISVSGGANSDVVGVIRRAVHGWKFQPARRGGKNVAAPMKIEFDMSVTRG